MPSIRLPPTMGTVGPRPDSALSPSTKWSLIAGGYLFVCAAVLLLLISQVASLVADLLALPSASLLWLAAPVPVVGAAVWWALVERRDAYTYPLGGAVGLITALCTVLLWILRGVFVWGHEMVLTGWPLVFAVLVPTVPAGLLAGVPLMYARRRGATGDRTPNAESVTD